MSFKNPPVAGTELIREAIQSRDYVAGTSGWSINRDGTAEFSDVTVRTGYGDAISTVSLAEIAAKLQREDFVLDREFDTVVTTAVRAQLTQLGGLPSGVVFPGVNPANPIAGRDITWAVTVELDIRPNAAAAGNFFCELDVSKSGGAYATQGRRIVARLNTNLDRMTVSKTWYPSHFTDQDIAFRFYVYHSAAPAYTIQDGANSHVSVAAKVNL